MVLVFFLNRKCQNFQIYIYTRDNNCYFEAKIEYNLYGKYVFYDILAKLFFLYLWIYQDKLRIVNLCPNPNSLKLNWEFIFKAFWFYFFYYFWLFYYFLFLRIKSPNLYYILFYYYYLNLYLFPNFSEFEYVIVLNIKVVNFLDFSLLLFI